MFPKVPLTSAILLHDSIGLFCCRHFLFSRRCLWFRCLLCCWLLFLTFCHESADTLFYRLHRVPRILWYVFDVMGRCSSYALMAQHSLSRERVFALRRDLSPDTTTQGVPAVPRDASLLQNWNDFPAGKIVQIKRSLPRSPRSIGPFCGSPSASRSSARMTRKVSITGTGLALPSVLGVPT